METGAGLPKTIPKGALPKRPDPATFVPTRQGAPRPKPLGIIQRPVGRMPACHHTGPKMTFLYLSLNRTSLSTMRRPGRFHNGALKRLLRELPSPPRFQLNFAGVPHVASWSDEGLLRIPEVVHEGHCRSFAWNWSYRPISVGRSATRRRQQRGQTGATLALPIPAASMPAGSILPKLTVRDQR